MKLKKLFQVLVVGGATLGAAKCGPTSDPNPPPPDDGGTTNTDGGTRNLDGGVHFW